MRVEYPGTVGPAEIATYKKYSDDRTLPAHVPRYCVIPSVVRVECCLNVDFGLKMDVPMPETFEGEDIESRQEVDAWPNWSDEQKDVLIQHRDYYSKQIELIAKAWEHGPQPAKDYTTIKAPVSDLKSLIIDYSGKKGGRKVKKQAAISKMTDTEFNTYLKSRLRNDAARQVMSTQCVEMPSESLESMADFLKKRHQEINSADNEILKWKLMFGEYLSLAQKRFMAIKRQQKFEGKWETWIKKNVGISFAYAKQLMKMQSMVKDYPRLRDLSVSFTELYGMRKRIEIIFGRCGEIRKEWK